MASFKVKTSNNYSVSSLISDFSANIPDEIIAKMLNSEAEVIGAKQRENAASMLNEAGKSKGETAAALTIKKASKSGNTMTAEIYFKGKRSDGQSASAVAFFNEFGNSKINGRAFIQKAIDEKSEEAFDRAEIVFREWQEKQ